MQILTLLRNALRRGVRSRNTTRVPDPFESGHFKVKSRFVRSRMGEMSWLESEYIDELMDLEQLVQKKIQGTRHYTASSAQYSDLRWRDLATRFPIEAEAIELEMRQGIEITPEVIKDIQERQRKGREEAVERRRQEEERKRAQAVEERKRWELEIARRKQEWLRKGGLP